MPSLDLLDVEPDKLFEIHTINEIDGILQTVNYEIERKRVELRTLVGERYRDLIEAADKIEEMKNLSGQVITDIDILDHSLGNLGKSSTCFSSLSLHLKPRIDRKASVADIVTAQLKLLIDLPPLIWAEIEDKKFLSATRLFLFSRHIRTGFTVDKSLKESKFGVPILEQQWHILSGFPGIILKNIEANIVYPNVNPLDCCHWLAAVSLLDCSLPILDRLLLYRTSSVCQLKSDSQAKLQLATSYEALISTLACVEFSFLEPTVLDEEGAVKQCGKLWKILYECNQSKPVFDECKSYSPLHTRLPPIITNFKVTFSDRSRLSNEDVKKNVNEWLEKISKNVTSQASSILRNISLLSALKTFDTITEEVAVGQVGNLLGITGLWDRFYAPVLQARALKIVTTEWDNILQDLKNSTEQSFSNSGESKKSENDLRWFIWKESASDLSFNPNRHDSKGGLWLKSRAISPRVASLCSLLEERLKDLNAEVSSLSQSHPELISEHKRLASSMIIGLKEYVRSVINKIQVEKADKNIIDSLSGNEMRLSGLARMLQAIPELCPSLKNALLPPDQISNKGWIEAKTVLSSEGMSVWSSWQSLICGRLKEMIPPKRISTVDKSPDTVAYLLCFLPKWDRVKVTVDDDTSVESSKEPPITAGDSTGASVKSDACLVPTPSGQFQLMLYRFNVELTRAAVPRLVADKVMEELVPHILESYPDECSCQNEAIQCLVDIRFLLAQYVNNSNQALAEKCLAKLKLIESNIDPFDLDQFNSCMNSTLKSTLLRSQGLYGGGSKDVHAGSGSQIKLSEEATVLPISSSCGSGGLFFPPLPVANPSAKPAQMKKAKASKVVTSKVTDGTEVFAKAGNVASSIFNEWFS